VAGSMTPSQPYLLRALHEWITDNDQTPLIVVDAAFEGVEVPFDYVEDGKLVLNVSWSATRMLNMDNDFIIFSARFEGTPYDIKIPVAAVLGIYSRESGQGMVFSLDDDEIGVEASGPTLTEVPNDGTNGPDDSSGDGSDDDPDGPDDGGGKPRPPHLKIVR